MKCGIYNGSTLLCDGETLIPNSCGFLNEAFKSEAFDMIGMIPCSSDFRRRIKLFKKKEEQNMIEAVIFDLDGLLIDSEVISYQLYQELLNKYGYSFTIENYAQNYSGKTELGNMETLVDLYQLPISVQEGLDYTLSREKEYFIKGVSLKPGVRELLDYLKNNQYKIALASSSTKDRALFALVQHGIDGCFDEMVFGTEVEKGKPNPDIFLKACKKLKADPEKCLVLEDSEAGIQASYSARIPVICIPDMKKPNIKYQKMTEMILPSLLDVILYLNKKTHL